MVKPFLGFVGCEVLVYGKDALRSGILGAETVAAADDLNITAIALGERCDNIEVERVAESAGLLGAVENCDLSAGRGDSGNELVRAERTVEAALDKTDLRLPRACSR